MVRFREETIKIEKSRKADTSPPPARVMIGSTADPIQTRLGGVGELGDVIVHTMSEVDRTRRPVVSHG